MKEKAKSAILISLNCSAVLAVILICGFGVAVSMFHDIVSFLSVILCGWVLLNFLNCILIKDYRVIFACTIVSALLPVLALLFYGGGDVIGRQITSYICLPLMVLFVFWSVGVTVYKTIRHKA